jgi:hypothetical protein
MRLGNDYRIRERLAEALVGPLGLKPDPWPMAATFCAGIALGMLAGLWLAQTNAQRQVIALTGRARELGTGAIGRARNRFEQDVVLEEADERQPVAPTPNKRAARPARVGSQR